jgi:TetR/AcrR family transcriptional regulator, regulator of cefoperazone and chloramphenicol sensitivity
LDKPISGAEITRITLVESAIRLFGARGYDSVSTREIADMAAANIGSIAYHFGGKPGLRKACAEHVISSIRSILGPAFARPLPPLSANEALATIEGMMGVLCRFWLSNPDSQIYIHFILRELMEAGEISQHFYSSWLKPMHIRLCALFGLATGLDPDSEDVKIAVFSIVGQVFHCRVSQEMIMKRLEWDEFGDKQAEKMTASLVKNCRAIVLAHRRPM